MRSKELGSACLGLRSIVLEDGNSGHRLDPDQMIVDVFYAGDILSGDD